MSVVNVVCRVHIATCTALSEHLRTESRHLLPSEAVERCDPVPSACKSRPPRHTVARRCSMNVPERSRCNLRRSRRHNRSIADQHRPNYVRPTLDSHRSQFGLNRPGRICTRCPHAARRPLVACRGPPPASGRASPSTGCAHMLFVLRVVVRRRCVALATRKLLNPPRNWALGARARESSPVELLTRSRRHSIHHATVLN